MIICHHLETLTQRPSQADVLSMITAASDVVNAHSSLPSNQQRTGSIIEDRNFVKPLADVTQRNAMLLSDNALRPLWVINRYEVSTTTYRWGGHGAFAQFID